MSPDGRRIAFGTDDGKEAIVWIFELSGATAMKALTRGSNNRFPTWSSDSKRVAFQSDRDGDRGLFWQPVDGGQAARLTTPDPGEAHEPESWSPDGDTLLFSVTKGSDVSLWTLSLTEKKATPFGDVHSSIRTGAVFSPDGRWVAYASWSIHEDHLRAAIPGHRRHLSAPARGGGAEASALVAGRDRALLQSRPRPVRVRQRHDPTDLRLREPGGGAEAVPGAAPVVRRPYDITPDGRFVSAIAAGQSASGRPTAPQIQVVLNWFEELRTRVPLTR